jgi:hypothetical protein
MTTTQTPSAPILGNPRAQAAWVASGLPNELGQVVVWEAGCLMNANWDRFSGCVAKACRDTERAFLAGDPSLLMSDCAQRVLAEILG